MRRVTSRIRPGAAGSLAGLLRLSPTTSVSRLKATVLAASRVPRCRTAARVAGSSRSRIAADYQNPKFANGELGEQDPGQAKAVALNSSYVRLSCVSAGRGKAQAGGDRHLAGSRLAENRLGRRRLSDLTHVGE